MLLELVEDHKIYLPAYAEVANPALNNSHWRDIFRAMDAEDMYKDGMQYSVVRLVELGVLDHLETIGNIGAAASKQYSMLKALENMIGAWDNIDFHCTPYKASEMFVLGQTEEIQMLLDDQLMKIQAMNASPYVKPFQERAKDWEKTLSNLQVGLLQLPAWNHILTPGLVRCSCSIMTLLMCALLNRACWIAGFKSSRPGCTWSRSSAAKTLSSKCQKKGTSSCRWTIRFRSSWCM